MHFLINGHRLIVCPMCRQQLVTDIPKIENGYNKKWNSNQSKFKERKAFKSILDQGIAHDNVRWGTC